ncbi:MAG: hypothetical protein R8N23_11295 [Reichenbachiella sp.]|uniref:hypothetical protein n=1 Tax=Reichenbachiella sp. TaxID=2184521 RepID=UPI002966F9D7|nr:hypothetical protein [Reichenbachiella sp.]MDW3210446.1 hypothetical protein [Reichenbachiella sp.]
MKIPRHIEGGTTEISPAVQRMLWKRSSGYLASYDPQGTSPFGRSDGEVLIN